MVVHAILVKETSDYESRVYGSPARPPFQPDPIVRRTWTLSA